MTAKEHLYTADDWPLMPNDDKRYELIEGAFIEMPPSSQRNAVLAAWIIYALWAYVLPRKLGFVTGPDSGYRITPKSVFQPDAAFISTARAGGLSAVVFPVAPDLAVEVISPGETAHSVLTKGRACLTAGGRLVWAVHPDDKAVDIYRLATTNGSLTVESVGIDGALDGDDVLPGFTLKLGDLFSVLES